MSTEMEILALEERRFAAMTAGDMAALAALVHDDLVYTHSSGVVDGKASWIDSIRSGRVRYRKVARTEQRVRIFGDTALVTGRATLEADINGEAKTLKMLFLNAWTRTPQGWKFVAWQSTPAPA